MKANTSSGKRRRWLRLGPGAIIALLAAVGIALVGRFPKPPAPDPNAGRIVFEADAQGNLRRVGAPSAARSPLPRLWKPEPGFLLEHVPALKLDASQRRKIETLNAAWLSAKAQMEQEIRRATSGASARALSAESGHNVSATQVIDNLKDYSRFSRQYDERRADYWRRSLALMTAEQQERLSKITETIRRTK